MDPEYIGEHTGFVYIDDSRIGNKNPQYHFRFALKSRILGTKPKYHRSKGEEFKLIKKYEDISFQASNLIRQAVARKNKGENIDLEHILDEPAISN